MIKVYKLNIMLCLLLVGISINVYYHWEAIWTKWAQYYTKDQEIVFSLTTTPHRIRELEIPLQCLSRQNAKIQQIYINVPHIFKRDNLPYSVPEWLENYPNVTILRTEDYGPATKILGTLKNAPLNPNTIVISVDDDTCYPANLALRLAVRSKMHPDEAIGVSGAVLDFEKNKAGGIVKIMRDNVAVQVLEGFAGIAYKPKFFNASIFEISNEPSFCYNSDDIYISFHLAKQKIVRRTLNNKFLNTYDIQQHELGYRADALYRMDSSQAERYKLCIGYLANKYPGVVF